MYMYIMFPFPLQIATLEQMVKDLDEGQFTYIMHQTAGWVGKYYSAAEMILLLLY